MRGLRPVDVSSKEREVIDRINRDRDATKEKLSMSRTNSRTGYDRGHPSPSTRTPPSTSAGPASPKSPSSVNGGQHHQQPKPALGPSVRPNLSFASAAAKKKGEDKKDEVEKEKVTEKAVEVNV